MTSSTQDFSAALGPPRVRKAGEVIADTIRAMILGQHMQAGDSLPSEPELINRFQVSRATVREALRILEAEGFVRIKRGPSGGVVVNHPDESSVARSLAVMLTLSQATLKDLFEFRLLTEPAAAAATARNASDQQRQALLDAAEAPPANHVNFKVEFHALLASAVGNDFLRVVLLATHNVVRWHVVLENLTDADVKATAEAHQKIAAAISNGDEVRAKNAMKKHIQRFSDRMEEQGRLSEPIIPVQRWRSEIAQTWTS